MKQKMSLLTKVCYGLGDFACQLVWAFVGTYLTVFYTDILGLAPVSVSLIMLFARIYDSVIDPLSGAVAERTKSRFGRFRPWILYGSPILVIVNVLVFTSPSFGGNATAKVIWAGATYIIFGTIYSVVSLSYGSLSTVMTSDPAEVMQLNSSRMIGTNLGAVLINAIAMPLILFFSHSKTPTGTGYTMTVLLFSLLSLPLFYLLFFNSKEVIQPKKEVKKVSIGTSFKVVLTNKPLICVFMIMMFSLISLMGRLGTVIFYYIYVVKRIDLISLFMVLPTLCTVISIFATAKFVDKVGRKRMCTIAYVGSALTLVGIYFTDVNNLIILMILTGLYGAFSFATPIPVSMIAEAIDYGEDKTGVRADGTSFALVSLSAKIAGAIGGSVGIMIMAAFGYVANAQQTPRALHGINLVVNILPAASFLLTLIPLYLYPLNKEKSEEIRARLRARE